MGPLLLRLPYQQAHDTGNVRDEDLQVLPTPTPVVSLGCRWPKELAVPAGYPVPEIVAINSVLWSVLLYVGDLMVRP